MYHAQTLPNMINMAFKPRWYLDMLSTSRRTFGNVVGHAQGVDNLTTLSEWSAQQLDPTLNWEDVAWVKEQWGGKLVLKGIMDPEDARWAVDSGADALIVSNYGGRQLDGGIRTGQDVFRAMALGAEGTFIGKAFFNGLGAMGEAGVERCLQIIAQEPDLTMAFCGHTDINEVDSSVIWQEMGHGSS